MTREEQIQEFTKNLADRSVAPTHFGNSYKLANYKANKFFNKNNIWKRKLT